MIVDEILKQAGNPVRKMNHLEREIGIENDKRVQEMKYKTIGIHGFNKDKDNDGDDGDGGDDVVILEL